MSPLPSHLEPYASCFAKGGAETGLDPLLVAAVCDREAFASGKCILNPPNPYGLGDNGHGHGLMQVDNRTWGAWLATHEWWLPEVNIPKGAHILHDNLLRFAHAFDPFFCAAAAYNCGPGNVHAALAHMPASFSDTEKRAHIDARTTHRDYASDCMRRWQTFKQEATT